MTTTDIAADTGAQQPPAEPSGTGLAQQVQWLVDRALIGDLLVEFARALDAKDWEAYVATYLPEGVFRAGPHLVLRGHDQLRAAGSPFGLGQYTATWHQSSNHAITIEGDTARSRSYLCGVHRLDDDLSHHADGGGWYDCTLRRTPQGWRFETVSITEVFHNDTPLPHMQGPPPGSRPDPA